MRSELPGLDPEDTDDPYTDIFGRFWDGMSFLVASIGAMRKLLGEQEGPLRFTDVGSLLEGLRAGHTQWPRGFLLWQQYAYAIVEAHGLLDEYARATYELLALSDAVAAELDPSRPWDPEKVEHLQTLEASVRADSDRFEQLTLWKRFARLRQRFGLRLPHDRQLEAAIVHQRRIRNGIVHGQLTPHVVMPDGSVGRMREYAPPPYVPLGAHVVRGAMSVVLTAHKAIDTAVTAHLGLAEDPEVSSLVDREIERGREYWFVDPWEPSPEHLFSPEALRLLRPST